MKEGWPAAGVAAGVAAVAVRLGVGEVALVGGGDRRQVLGVGVAAGGPRRRRRRRRRDRKSVG